ncbi:endolytic transglycosylase MltG [Fibrisoma montanum]|uniref:Endolytic murein transglycosylase n=1 Tax=Fibrisoma montanum TaxID=2305895 RepID=A0A418LZ03_9BACT|nr:endolytic transglycosylase MltG [Fibrisoma montanum]RIV18451.1 endolytic transglycosylase MltG [Fibrisoma montanum]
MSRNFKIGAFLTISILVTTFSFYFWQVFKTPNLNAREGAKEPFALLIPKGSTFDSVVDSLKKHDALEDEVSFRFLARLMKYNQRVKEGRYEIPPNTGNYNAIVKLRSGSQDPMTVTFNNIRLKSDLVQRLGGKFEFSTDTLAQLMNDPEVCARFGFDTTTIVCMFLPNTYEFFWTIKPEAFLERMGKEYKKFWTPERQAKAKALGLTQTQVQVLASIVAAETNKRDEQPRVAGVYLNRLERGIRLEADPTLVFAHRDFTIRRVLNVHKAINSPYNTYRFAGLPPGPINLPSPATIDAVLNPEEHDYLYFVAKADFSGYHTFSKTLTEHMANARIYQQALTQRNIMR